MSVDLTLLNMYLYRYILSCALFFGIIGSVLNTIVFLRKKLRDFPCSLYYLMQSIVCLLLLCTAILFRYLAEGYQIDLPAHSSHICKLFLYTSSTLRCLSALFILCSTVDRYLASSASIKLRHLSQIKYAIYTICLIVISIAILFIYIPIYFGDSSALVLTCSQNGHGTLTLVHNLFNAFILAIFVPFMLITFSILTFKNIQRRRQLVHTTNTAAQQRQDNHMIRLMLCQSFIYLILVAVNAIFNLYSTFIPLQTNAKLLFIYKLSYLLQYIHAATAFYVNTLASRTYRDEVIKILDTIIRHVFHSTIIERHMLQRKQRQQTQTQNIIPNSIVV